MELDTSLSPPSPGKERDARLSPYVQAAYRVITAAATPLLGLLLLVRQALGKESATRLRERWGHATTRRPRGRLVWLHAASLGEGAAALPLITKILEESPSTSILVTGGSVAADDWRRRAFPAEVIRQFVPVDTPAAVERFVTHWKPDVGIFVESELWPNLIARSSANGVRLALVNARMSASSAKMWSLPVANCLFRDTLRNFHVISTQNDRERVRFAALGADVARMTQPADLKLVSASTSLARRNHVVHHHHHHRAPEYLGVEDDADRHRGGDAGHSAKSVIDVEVSDVSDVSKVSDASDASDASDVSDVSDATVLNAQPRKPLEPLKPPEPPRREVPSLSLGPRGRRVWWLAASTHVGEEAACARVHLRLRRRFPSLLTCVVPRHVERASRLVAELRGAGLSVARFSEGAAPRPETEVLLVDVVGILPELYRAARGRPVFVGGSLFADGNKGHNVAEATLAGCAVLVGAHHETFQSMIEDINGAGVAAAGVPHSARERRSTAISGAVEISDRGRGDGSGGGGGGDRRNARACEVVTCERELFLGVETRLEDVGFAAALGDAGAVGTRELLSGVLERLWSDLSARLFLDSTV